MHIKDLCNEIEQLTKTLNEVMAANEKITSKLVIVRNVNINLQNQLVNLKELLVKDANYHRRNNVEISGISNKILD